MHSIILLKSSRDGKSKGVIILSGQEAKTVDAFMKFIRTLNNGCPKFWHLQNWVGGFQNVVFRENSGSSWKLDMKNIKLTLNLREDLV